MSGDSDADARAAAQAVLDALSAAWARGDAAALAALFCADGVLVRRSGAAVRGRERIRAAHARALGGAPGAVPPADCRVLAVARRGEALAVSATRTVRRGAARDTHAVEMTLAREGGEWRVARFAAARGGGGGGGGGWGARAAAAAAAVALALALGGLLWGRRRRG